MVIVLARLIFQLSGRQPLLTVILYLRVLIFLILAILNKVVEAFAASAVWRLTNGLTGAHNTAVGPALWECR